MKANFMSDHIKSERLNYNVGAFVVFTVSLGIAAIVYGGGFLEFEPLNLIAWVLSPLGIYTAIYAFKTREDRFYYLAWGLVMLVFGLSSIVYKVMNIVVLFGLLLILLAVMGSITYWRRRG